MSSILNARVTGRIKHRVWKGVVMVGEGAMNQVGRRVLDTVGVRVLNLVVSIVLDQAFEEMNR